MQVFYKAIVEKIINEGTINNQGVQNSYQDLKLKILEGPDKNKEIVLQNGGQTLLSSSQKVSTNQTVIVTATQGQNLKYTIYDKYRLTPVISVFIVFSILVLIIAKFKGLGSLLGITISLAVILAYIVPSILAGADPLSTTIYGSLMILLVTTYLAHGISKQTTVALVSTFFGLVFTVFISWLFINLSHLSGFNEETSILQFGPTSKIDLNGLLLSGIIIGSLGALNDITTTQAATIFEIVKTDSNLSFNHVFKKGFDIGREHIVSMVNTLVLAYTGSALAVFFFLVLNPQKLPLWVIINSEDISDEIIRTISGSMGLILIIPLVTAIAAWVAIQTHHK